MLSDDTADFQQWQNVEAPAYMYPQIPIVCNADGLIDQAMNDMLMAWYHSGYATARYYYFLEYTGY